MPTTNVKFKVAMDNEQKKLGNIKDITFDVSFDGVDPSVIQKAAIANMIVQWQGQIRSHWTEFTEKGLPEVVTFGNPLFASRGRAAAAPLTSEAALTHIKGQDRLTQITMAIDLMESIGQDVPDDLLEEELQLKQDLVTESINEV